MKKFIKVTGVCVGLALLNLVTMTIVSTLFLLFTNNVDVVNNYAFLITFVADCLTIVIALSFPNLNIKKSLKIKLNKIINIIFLSIGTTIVLLFLTGILSKIIPSYSKISNTLSSSTDSLFKLILVIVLIPICEEIFYRGIIFNYLKSNINIIPAVFFQAFIFGFMHFNTVQGIYTFLLGIALAFSYMYTESIIGNIIFHIIFNLLGILVIPRLISVNSYMYIFIIIIAIISFLFAAFRIIKNYK